MEIKAGDKVMWRGAWGTQEPKPMVVAAVSIDPFKGLVYDLVGGHWCYAHQITLIKKEAK